MKESMLQTFCFQELQAGTEMHKARSAWKLLHIKVGPFPFLLMNFYLILHYSAMWLICIFIKIHKNTTNTTYVVCPYCSSSQRSAVVFSAQPALDETHIHLQRKIGFGKPKILVTVFQMIKCERTGNLYKHAQSLLELRRKQKT